jgi:hypothetical protein
MVKPEAIRYLVGIIAGMLVYIMIVYINMAGWETLIGSLAAGAVASLYPKSAKKAIASGVASPLLGIISIIIYYSIINLYGVKILFSTGLILYIPIITSLIFGSFGAMVVYSIRQFLS